MVRFGLERLLTDVYRPLLNRRIGLITNQTGVDSRLRSNVDLLSGHSDYELSALYGPEHGIKGSAAAGDKVDSYIDRRTGLPVYSLYGIHLEPGSESLYGLEALVFDILDCGSRYYTYIYTMAYAMRGAAKHGLPFVVLDRPNPATGIRVEGNVVKPGFESFVGLYPIPMRHGMTIGELAQLFNERFDIGCDLQVITMEGYKRTMWWEETGNPWVMPSPSAPTPEFAVVYPGTCLFEGTNLSEGHGTTKPFQIIGAPWIAAEEMAEALNELGLAGVIFRPTNFIPSYSKYQSQHCEGVQLHVLDRNTFEPIRAALEIIALTLRMYQADFAWVKHGDNYFFDSLAGTDQLRKELTRGISPVEIIDSWNDELNTFMQLRMKYLLY